MKKPRSAGQKPEPCIATPSSISRKVGTMDNFGKRRLVFIWHKPPLPL